MGYERTVLSLFTGIGGLDMGFGGEVVVHADSASCSEWVDRAHTVPDFVILKKLNFKCVFQNDICKKAHQIYGWNNSNSHSYNTTSITELLATDFEFPAADVVIGGFPCQDFSQAGKRGGTCTERGSLYKCFVEVVKRVKPRVFVAENVYGLLTMKGEPIKQIMSDFGAAGYHVAYQVICCSDFGIPQKRKRVIIIGRLGQEQPSWGWNIIDKNRCSCTVGKYFEHLEEPEHTSDFAQMAYSKAKKLSKGQGQAQVGLQSHAPTIRAEHHGNIEFIGDRRLTVREAGLLQTFPPDFVFSKSVSQIAYRPIGNAVPPLLSYLIAGKVADLLNEIERA